MSQAAVAVLIVRGVPIEHRPSKTSTATALAVVMRWKLSTAVAMSAAMTATTLPCSTESVQLLTFTRAVEEGPAFQVLLKIVSAYRTEQRKFG